MDRSRNQRSQVELAKEYLLARSGHCSNEECAAAASCSPRTVVRARHELQRLNPLIPPAPRDKHATVTLSATGAEEIERSLAAIRGDTGAPLDDAEKLQMLAVLARRAYREDNAKLAGDLMTVHTKIRESASEKPTLGPPPPLTRDELIDRTWAILDCAGPDVTAHAALRAFGTKCLDCSTIQPAGTNFDTFCTTLDRLKVTAPHSHQSSIEGESSASAAVIPLSENDA